MNYNIYLVEDDVNLNNILTSYLENEGWAVQPIFTGLDGKKLIDRPPHLWILDIMLPDIDGYELIKEIKSRDKNIPVIFISARDEDIDRVIGLEFGSDDYLAKPFLPRELVIRVKNLLERVYGPKEAGILKIQGYEIDLSSRLVYLGGEVIDLTTKEFKLLKYFLDNLNKALSRESILTTIWGHDYFGSDRVVDDLIRRLRSKLSRLNIKTIYGYGYMVSDNEKI